MFEYFFGIYRNTYYNSDTWKVALHFTEELGEATTELSRLELIHNIRCIKEYTLPKEEIINELQIKKDRIEREINTNDKTRDKSIEKIEKLYSDIVKNINNDNDFSYYATLIGLQLKEEISDVFSWLVAVMYMLNGFKNDITSVLKNMVGLYNQASGKEEILCPYCHQLECSDRCLVSHAIAKELQNQIYHQ